MGGTAVSAPESVAVRTTDAPRVAWVDESESTRRGAAGATATRTGPALAMAGLPASPEYRACTLRSAACDGLTVRVASPLTSDAEPRTWPPLTKVTDPVG
ncbi:hypothetical protein ACAN107058_14675 [Paracidovorax anthurii]